MDELTLLLRANSAQDNHSAQSDCHWLQKIRRYCLISWFALSVWPSVCRRRAVEKFSVIPNSAFNAQVKFETNVEPLSEMMRVSNPKSFQTWSRYLQAVPSEVIVLLQGIRQTIFESQSMQTIKESNPLERGRSTMKSQEIISQ